MRGTHQWRQTRATRWQLLCGAIGGPLFVVAILIQGAVRAGYDPLRDTGSELSIGAWGWIQIANFVVTGLLMLAFAVGLREALHSGPGATWAPRLMTAFGASLIVAGVFVSDPVPHAAGTWQGRLHTGASLVVFVSLTALCFVMARRFAWQRTRRGWMLYSAVTGVAVPVCFIAMGASGDLVGLFQRVAIVLGWGWIAVLATSLAAGPDPVREV